MWAALSVGGADEDGVKAAQQLSGEFLQKREAK